MPAAFRADGNHISIPEGFTFQASPVVQTGNRDVTSGRLASLGRCVCAPCHEIILKIQKLKNTTEASQTVFTRILAGIKKKTFSLTQHEMRLRDFPTVSDNKSTDSVSS